MTQLQTPGESCQLVSACPLRTDPVRLAENLHVSIVTTSRRSVRVTHALLTCTFAFLIEIVGVKGEISCRDL